jgi:hypothetical protein
MNSTVLHNTVFTLSIAEFQIATYNDRHNTNYSPTRLTNFAGT